jgi:hypothetical protein
VQKKVNYPEEFILPDKSTKIPPEIKHYGPAYVQFSNSFAHFLDYTGQGYGFIYDGDWCKDRNYTIAEIISGHATQPACLSVLPEKENYLWETIGFPSSKTFYANPANADYMSEQDMKDTIKHTLYTLGQPVIISQENVIGFKDNANTLIIYRYIPYWMNQENNAHPETVEISDWYNDNTKLFIAGKREKILSLIDIYKEGTRRIRDCLCENIRGEKQRYYSEWEAFLRMHIDEMITEAKRIRLVPGGEENPYGMTMNDENIWEYICASHSNTWCTMAECRYYVMNFFRQAKEYFPEIIDDLQELDNHFWYTSDIMGSRYNKEIGDPVDAEAFKNPEIRVKMAACVREFKEADAKGLEMVEKLLEWNCYNI